MCAYCHHLFKTISKHFKQNQETACGDIIGSKNITHRIRKTSSGSSKNLTFPLKTEPLQT
jgi:hypothetical protein